MKLLKNKSIVKKFSSVKYTKDKGKIVTNSEKLEFRKNKLTLKFSWVMILLSERAVKAAYLIFLESIFLYSFRNTSHIALRYKREERGVALERIIVFLDYELDYAAQLAAYLNVHRRFPFRVVVVTAMPELKAFLQRSSVEILVTVPEYRSEAERLYKEQQIQKLFYFIEKGNAQENMIYRFQSAEKIRRILQKGEDTRAEEGNIVTVGIFSPAGGIEKSHFSKSIALSYAKEGRTLLLSFEPYAVWETNGSGGLSELIFYIKQRDDKLIIKLQELVKETKEYTYLCGVRYCEDLFGLNREDISYLFKKLDLESLYDTIVCDVGGLGSQSIELLKICNLIYMPVFSEKEAKERQDVFIRQMKEIGRGKILDCMVEVDVSDKVIQEESPEKYYMDEAREAIEKGGRLLAGTKAADL